jgi:nicotinamide-nucleotide amidase
MKTAEIICVGTELLMGQIVNTNAQYIAQRLSDAGIALNHCVVVGDNPKRLTDAVVLAKSRSDILIFTGGLGPTDDDLTKETVSEEFGKKLVLHQKSMDDMIAYFAASGKAMAKNNEKQAYLPEGCIAIENKNGTAPGCIIEEDGIYAILLPGPPREMRPMFEDSVLPFLKSISECVLSSRVLRMFGIGESSAAEVLDDIIKEQTNPTVAPYAKEGEVTFRVTASGKDENEANRLLGNTVNKIYERLGEYIYAEGDDNSLANVVVQELLRKKLTVATAESCTGGLLGEKITSIPGASEVYGFGFVTYANEAKEKLLGVDGKILETVGAVSAECAKSMALGAREKSGADIAVSVTGIAGPGGGSEEKPVGTVYIGFCDKNGCDAYLFHQAGTRERVREKSALCALDIIRKRAKAL